MTKKKMRFKKARELRKHGIPFGLAKKMANQLVRYQGIVSCDNLEGVWKREMVRTPSEFLQEYSDYYAECVFVDTGHEVLVFDYSMNVLVEKQARL